ncbi:hypothetical protein XELAEV_18025666mg [Xenopus laevis]|uniref:Uncharacterized protein n=1 Tax=Xenopus laevis TaxID=8355 RepID=A0A974D2G7_XENLA|nr:hypothetical protein XELAEV_18025666mg [Xenopus laevis]
MDQTFNPPSVVKPTSIHQFLELGSCSLRIAGGLQVGHLFEGWQSFPEPPGPHSSHLTLIGSLHPKKLCSSSSD